MCVFPKWYEHNHRQPELYPFAGNPENGFDYETPNVCFFQHLESCISALESLGIEADIILFHPYESSDWRFNWMTERQDRQYLRYITARLSAFHNVWWSLANEYDLLQTGYKRKKAAWKRLIQFVHDCDPYGHLLSIHQLSRMYDYRDPNVTHCSIQRTELYLTAEYTDTWREKYGKPVVIDECVYEGNLNAWWGGITAQELVRRFWEAAARGGYMRAMAKLIAAKTSGGAMAAGYMVKALLGFGFSVRSWKSVPISSLPANPASIIPHGPLPERMHSSFILDAISRTVTPCICWEAESSR